MSRAAEVADNVIYDNACRYCPRRDVCCDQCEAAIIAAKAIEDAFATLTDTIVTYPYPDEA